MFVTSPSPKLPWIAGEALNGGATLIQWRQKSGVGSGYNRTYAGLSAVVQDSVPLIVNVPWETAEKIHAAHIHLPEKSVSIATARKLVGPKALVGKSVRSVAGAIEAASEGADYLIAGTVFSSKSHPDLAPAGLTFLESVCRAVTIPVTAIGGITPENAESCIRAGASGVAVQSAFIESKEPASLASAYVKSMMRGLEGDDDIDDQR